MTSMADITIYEVYPSCTYCKKPVYAHEGYHTVREAHWKCEKEFMKEFETPISEKDKRIRSAYSRCEFPGVKSRRPDDADGKCPDGYTCNGWRQIHKGSYVRFNCHRYFAEELKELSGLWVFVSIADMWTGSVEIWPMGPFKGDPIPGLPQGYVPDVPKVRST
ncbi:hypothetical protein JWZ98_03290 [Methylomonas sp. EFPC1]|uniref:hypothetical protein n=1 Tax=Methylomonas sp. EFPC1 TaxID=2812647 RepID=UPI0019686172|nr:hypothetical protein [Methylomonas sp. EFPC1]QSB02000.1 hypothetical protein JWZ98_03290 [Methylomonas sp. EFPC1]